MGTDLLVGLVRSIRAGLKSFLALRELNKCVFSVESLGSIPVGDGLEYEVRCVGKRSNVALIYCTAFKIISWVQSTAIFMARITPEAVTPL